MKLAVSESFQTLVELTVSALGTVIFTGVGLVVEQTAVADVLRGQIAVGVWEGWMGAIALVVGIYLLGYRELWPRLQTL